MKDILFNLLPYQRRSALALMLVMKGTVYAAAISVGIVFSGLILMALDARLRNVYEDGRLNRISVEQSLIEARASQLGILRRIGLNRPPAAELLAEINNAVPDGVVMGSMHIDLNKGSLTIRGSAVSVVRAASFRSVIERSPAISEVSMDVETVVHKGLPAKFVISAILPAYAQE